jgi:hypothetical protein
MMESLMACGRRFVLLAFKSKPVRFGSRTGRGLKPSTPCSRREQTLGAHRLYIF